MAKVEDKHTIEVVGLSQLVMGITDTLVDLGVFPIWDISIARADVATASEGEEALHQSSIRDHPPASQVSLGGLGSGMSLTLVSRSKLGPFTTPATSGYPAYHLFFCFWSSCNVHIHIHIHINV
jgi:hypothetical protein